MFDSIGVAFGHLGNPVYWIGLAIALGLGGIIGLIPGMSASLMMALAIPIIVFDIKDPAIGIVVLASIAGMHNTLEAIPAILTGQPGAATQVTFLEGTQLARRGLAAFTLGVSYGASVTGAVVGGVVLLLVIPFIQPFILSFSFPEIAAMAIFGVAMVAALSAGARIKGTAAGLLGILLGTIGIDPITGASRFTLGQIYLWEGLPLIPVVLGIFALPEMIDLTLTRSSLAQSPGDVSLREVMRGVTFSLKRWKIVVRQSLFGALLGAIPGVGSSVIDWLAYAVGIFFARDKTEFGQGSAEGVLFAESAQNSKEGGQAIPTLAFGVPGGQGWALVLAGMLIYGVSPGPALLGRYADITILMVISLVVGHIALVIVAMLASSQLARLTLIPYPLIGAIIIPFGFLAGFLETTNFIAIWIILAVGAIGLAMKLWGWPRPPFVLGFILGPIIETNLQSALSIYGAWGMLTRPLTIVLLVLAIGIAYLFSRMSDLSESTPVAEASGGGTVPPPPAGSAPGPGRLAALRGLTIRPSRQSIFTVGLLALALVFFVASFHYRARARFLPVLSSGGIIGLCLFQLMRESIGHKTGRIMDIGMRSAATEGVKGTAALMGAWLTGYIVLDLIIGLNWASIAAAGVGPLLFMRGRARWIGAVVAVLFLTTFEMVLMNHIMHVIWPESLLNR